MKLEIKAVITDDEGSSLVAETLSYEGNKSGIVHAVKPMGDAIIYAIQLGLFYKKQVPIKDALGNVRTIAKDVVNLVEPSKELESKEKK